MAEPVTYHLAGMRGWWSLWQENETQPIFQTGRKLEAVARARALARENGARLIIHSQSGAIKTDRTFPHTAG